MKVRTFPVCGHEKALWELKTIESDPDATRRKRQTGNLKLEIADFCYWSSRCKSCV